MQFTITTTECNLQSPTQFSITFEQEKYVLVTLHIFSGINTTVPRKLERRIPRRSIMMGHAF